MTTVHGALWQEPFLSVLPKHRPDGGRVVHLWPVVGHDGWAVGSVPSSRRLDPGYKEELLIYNPDEVSRGLERMKEVLSGFVELEERISEHIRRYLKENIRGIWRMNRLFPDLGIQLCENRTHGGHTLFSTSFLLVPNVASFQHAYYKGRRMRYRSIALGGGGMRGVAHLGALKAIQEAQGSLEFPDGIYGSSVGAIVAAFVAFNVPLETMMTAVNKYFKLSAWLPYPSVSDVWSISQRKGLFSMELLRKAIIACFADCGIKDAETKKVSDAVQPLFIVASNMTTRRPALLTGDVPLIQAILCSCCIPGIFEPQILYGDVYLDAGVYVRCQEQIAPPGSLAIKLYDQKLKITAKSSLYEILHACYIGVPKTKPDVDVCSFKDLNIGIMSELTDKQREGVIEQGYSQTRSFLTKMAAKESK